MDFVNEFFDSYISPNNTYAKWIINTLLCLFFVWLSVFLYKLYTIIRQKKKLANISITEIERAIQDRLKSTFMEIDDPEKHFESIFKSFRQNNSLVDKASITRHLYVIFNAGWRESTLDIGELLDSTLSKVFAFNSFLRSILAMFIILGLLGTLFGLADSLVQLAPTLRRVLINTNSSSSPSETEKTSTNPSLKQTGQSTESTTYNQTSKQPANPANKELSLALDNFLNSLKSAFGPSILGVFLTVIGMLFYNISIPYYYSSFKSELEYKTITQWVPRLYPTPSQAFLLTLQANAEQIQKNLVSANEVADFARNIKDKASELSVSINGATNIINALNVSSTKLDTFSVSFTENVKRLTSFQEEISTLYNQLIKDSKAFQKNTEATVFNVENYIKDHHNLDTKIGEVLNAAQKAYEDLGNRNRELSEIIGRPLINNIESVSQNLKTELGKISIELQKLDVPMRKNVEKVEGAILTFDNRSEKLLEKLGIEFYEYRNLTKDQINGLNQLSSQIASFLEQLQNAQVRDQHILNLTNKVELFSNKIETFTKTIERASNVIQENIEKIPKEDKININNNQNLYFEQLLDITKKFANSAESLNHSIEALNRRSSQIYAIAPSSTISATTSSQRKVTVSESIFPKFSNFFKRFFKRK